MDNNTINLLNKISKNAEMGKNSTKQLIEITKDASLLHHLQKQLSTYEDLSRRAHAMLAVNGKQPKEQNPMAKMSANMGIRMKTLADDSPKKMAEMLIEGSTMGIRDMQKALAQVNLTNTNSGAIALAQRLESAESAYRQELSTFL